MVNKRSLLYAYNLIKFSFGKPKMPMGASIDVTWRCNVNCEHCYFKEQKYHQDTSDEKWLEIFQRLKYQGIIHCTWVGGEPLLRKELVRKGIKFFDFNWVVTNGTLPIPEWKDCNFFVSIHGPEKIHNKIVRANTYQKIKENLNNNEHAKIFIASVLNNRNYKCLDNFVVEWNKSNVKGIQIDFYTPVKNKNEDLWINFKKRDKILEKLKVLEKEYGDFILLNDRIIDSMNSENCASVTSRCPVKKCVSCFDTLGKVKNPCVMGEIADCNRCGCIIPFLLNGIIEKNSDTLKLFYKMVT